MNHSLRPLASAAALALMSGTAMAETTLRAVTAFPSNLAFSKSFQGFVDLVNERGAGTVKIQIMGGPEVVPPNQQLDAVKRGVVEMQYGPATYALGSFPEAYAWVGATVPAPEARQNGGLEAMREAMAEKLGVYLLGQPDSDIDFYIYTVAEPKRTAEGGVDLSGMQLRSLPIYNKFFESLGAVPVSVPVPDVYTGLERNTFNGLGFPIIGVRDLSWDKFLKYRVDPGFFNGDLAIVMNPAAWEGLSPEAQEILTTAATDWEVESNKRFAELATATNQELLDEGLQIVELEGDAAAAYLDAAYATSWDALQASGSPYYDRLRAAYYNR